MSWSGLKPWVFALQALLVAGCGLVDDVESSRSSAKDEVSSMKFLLDRQSVLDELDDADTSKVVSVVLDGARRENNSRADQFWSCIEPGSSVLLGSWGGELADGKTWHVAELFLFKNGAATLSEAGVAERIGASTSDADLDWLVSNLGQVHSFRSSFAQDVAQHKIVGDPVLKAPHSCSFGFDLELVAKSEARSFEARLDRDGEVWQLMLGGVEWDPWESGDF